MEDREGREGRSYKMSHIQLRHQLLTDFFLCLFVCVSASAEVMLSVGDLRENPIRTVEVAC